MSEGDSFQWYACLSKLYNAGNYAPFQRGQLFVVTCPALSSEADTSLEVCVGVGVCEWDGKTTGSVVSIIFCVYGAGGAQLHRRTQEWQDLAVASM